MSTVAADASLAAPAFEAATYRKVARRLVPFLFLLYVINFLDRANVSYAKLQMSDDLGFSEAVYGLGAGIFFLGYFCFEIPSNLIFERVGARFWIARILIVWGLISSAFLFVHTPAQFYSMRFLLGVAEAGFFPGVILYLTYWFPAHRRAGVVAMFMTSIAVSGIVGGPLSGGIMRSMAGVHGLAGWQWLFLLEGLPAILFGFVTLWYLDDGPKRAKWLSAEERALVLRQVEEERLQKNAAGAHVLLRAALRDYRIWILALIYFSDVVAFYGVSMFLPQLIKEMGVTDIFHNGLVSAIPWIVGVIAMVLNSRHSDRTSERRWHTAVPAFCAGCGLVAAAYVGSSSIVPAMITLTITCAASMCFSPVFWSLATPLVSGSAAAGSIALINSLGALGGFPGPWLVGAVKDQAGSPVDALYLLSGFFFLCGILTVTVFRPHAGQRTAKPARAV